MSDCAILIPIKFCSQCKAKHPATLEYFYADKYKKDGLKPACKKCDLVKVNAYQRTTHAKLLQKRFHKTDKWKQYSKQYRRKSYASISGLLKHKFAQMKDRCNNPNCQVYKYYGARGVKVCFKSVNEFIDYVINELQIDPRGLEIDRIDNDGNYERGNIQFVTHKENCQNRG